MTNKTFIIDNVEFSLMEAFSLLKVTNIEIDEIIPFVHKSLEEDIKKLFDKAVPMEIEEAIKFDNTEKRRVALSKFPFTELMTKFEGKLIDKQTIIKNNKRWKIENDGITEYNDIIEDTYELYELIYKEKQRWNNEIINIIMRAVKCFCTTTGREYFLYVPPLNYNEIRNSWSRITPAYSDDAIESICQTFTTNVKPEAVKYIYRQGDIIIVAIKPKYKENYKCSPRTITKEEYLTKLTSET